MMAGNTPELEDYGWDSHFSDTFQSLKVPNSVPARVVSVEKDSCQVFAASGEIAAQLSGHMLYRTGGGRQYPAVGDWVVICPLAGESKGIIQAVLPRKSRFSRQASGGSKLHSSQLSRKIAKSSKSTLQSWLKSIAG